MNADQFSWNKHIQVVQSAIEKQNDALAEAVLNVLLDVSNVVPVEPSTRINLMSKLGNLEHRQGKGQARQRFEDALKFADESGASDDGAVAFILDGLADCHQAAEEYDEAEKLRQRAIVIADERFGQEHPNTSFLREKQSTARQEKDLAQLGRDASCKTLFDMLAEQQSARGGEPEPLPPHDPSQENVAVFLWEKYINNGSKDISAKNWREAEGSLRSALERAQAFKVSDPRRCQTLRLLAQVLEELGKVDEARSCYEQALTLAFNYIGANSAESAKCMEVLGDYFSKKDDFGLAKNYYKQAGNAFVLSVGSHHPDATAAQEKLSALLGRVKEEKKWSGWSA
ncbi:MAG TPA: tetratricopeptide repeat protein [Candidatus Obscuribacterales bacterium]